MSNVKSGIGLKSYEWSSLELLKGLSIEQIKSNPSKLEERRPFFWHDMSSEFDSINFLRYLFCRRDIQFSNEFIEFVCLWHLDEQNHYRGLRKINSVLYSMPEDMIDREIRSNSPDFSHIEDFMKDEFTILLSIAFDEVTSTRAYKQDVSFFDSFENESLSTWIRYAARDEAAHYGNAMKILRLNHSHRFDEVEAILDKIVEFETSESFDYQRTFIFDHDTDDFSHVLLKDSRDTILEVLRGK